MCIQNIFKNHEHIPIRASFSSIIIAGIGGFIAVSCIAFLALSLQITLVLGSFGASAVLLFGFPDVPFSQPRNIIFGHIMSATIGMLCLIYLGDVWWSLGIAVGGSLAAMMLTRTVHPPAGSNPVIIFLSLPHWDFIFFPTAVGACILVVIAIFYHNVTRKQAYPRYW